MSWLLCRRKRPDAPLRMYCFPHSGGSAGEFLRWSDRLPRVEVLGVQLPGRGSRLDEPPLTSMAELVPALLAAVDFTGPSVFFGHSLGALVAYETALALRDAGRAGPSRLYLSGYRAPHLHDPNPADLGLPDDQLLTVVENRRGELPHAVKADPVLLGLAMPALRADLTVVATYRRSRPDPLPSPLTLLGGTEDDESGEALAAWRDYTTAGHTVREFPGGHFYFRDHPDEVLAFLAGRLDEDIAGS